MEWIPATCSVLSLINVFEGEVQVSFLDRFNEFSTEHECDVSGEFDILTIRFDGKGRYQRDSILGLRIVLPTLTTNIRLTSPRTMQERCDII